MSELVTHPLKALWNEYSRVLILGTMPSPASRERAFYYAHPQNRFWTVISAVLVEPFSEEKHVRQQMLLRHGIALWDVLQQCAIKGAADQSIRDPIPNDISFLLERAPIQAIFTTGQTAARLYARLCQPCTQRVAIPLPSTSPANCACSLEKLIAAYAVIRPWLKDREGELSAWKSF